MTHERSAQLGDIIPDSVLHIPTGIKADHRIKHWCKGMGGRLAGKSSSFRLKGELL